MTTTDPLATYLLNGGFGRQCEELARLMRACQNAGCDGYQLPSLDAPKRWDDECEDCGNHESECACDTAAHPAPTSSPGEELTVRVVRRTRPEIEIAADDEPDPNHPTCCNERDAAREELERVSAENARLSQRCLEAQNMAIEVTQKLTESERLVSELRAELAQTEAERLKLLKYYGHAPDSAESVNPEVVALKAELAKREAVGAGAEELRPMFLDAPRDGACKACGRLTTARVGSDGFCSQCRGFRNIWLYAREHKCRACNQTLELENFRIADGCPCNAPRGINHGLVPILTCTCESCDPKQTGSTRYWELTALEQPQAEPGREIVEGDRVLVRGGNMYAGYRGIVESIDETPVLVRFDGKGNGGGTAFMRMSELQLDPPVSEGEG